MIINDHQWSRSINDYLRLSTSIADYIWFSLIITDYQWLSTMINGYQWLSMIIKDSQGLSMSINDYKWLSRIDKDYQRLHAWWYVPVILLHKHNIFFMSFVAEGFGIFIFYKYFIPDHASSHREFQHFLLNFDTWRMPGDMMVLCGRIWNLISVVAHRYRCSRVGCRVVAVTCSRRVPGACLATLTISNDHQWLSWIIYDYQIL